MRQVTVIDIGIGNIHSVMRALEQVGAKVTLTTDPDDVLRSGRIVFPGVGAFGDCAASAARLGILEALREYCSVGKPLIGLCVGMQLLFESSSEFGLHLGMGVLAGGLELIPEVDANGQPLRVPHIGWSDVRQDLPGKSCPLFAGLPEYFSAYFLHSYAVRRRDAPSCCCTVTYGGHQLVAAVQKDMVFGTQFHPEKSAQFGLKILENFTLL